jgi:prevent-host-death family protein
MESIGAHEAKTHLSNLLEGAFKGEKIMITKHGVPLAILQPPVSPGKPSSRLAIAAIRQFRDKHALKGLSVREMIEEGRR